MISPLRATFFVAILVLFGLGVYDVLVSVEDGRRCLALEEEPADAPEFLVIPNADDRSLA